MKYGFMMLTLLVAMPSCCLRKKKTMEQPMIIEEETMPMQGATMDTTTGMDTNDMAIMEDEMTQDTTPGE